MYKAILFDMDGTLLSVDHNDFIKVYTTELMKVMLSVGSDVATLTKGFYAGVHAMRYNDGRRINADAYWQEFGRVVGGDIERYRSETDAFYTGAYHKVHDVVSINPDARRAVEAAKAKGMKVVVATSPLFPHIAQVTRLNWAGFEESEFEFVTHYESEIFCKPSPSYFISVCERLGLEPSECLMVGNDVSDDMIGANATGLCCFLVTDYLIESPDNVWQSDRGTMAELADIIENM